MIDRPTQDTGSRAVRLIFEYEGDRITLRDVLKLETATPPSDPIKGIENQSGFWYELRGRDGQLLYRRLTGNPIQFEVEVHDPEIGFTRHAIDEPRGAFTVLLPDLPEATDVVLMASSMKPEDNARNAERIGSFPLKGERDRSAR